VCGRDQLSLREGRAIRYIVNGMRDLALKLLDMEADGLVFSGGTLRLIGDSGN
jgi:hypothetical protein